MKACCVSIGDYTIQFKIPNEYSHIIAQRELRDLLYQNGWFDGDSIEEYEVTYLKDIVVAFVKNYVKNGNY